MTRTAPAAKVIHLRDVPPVSWAGGESGRFLLRAEDTGGLFSYYQVTVPAGQGTLLHLHEEMDETFHVVAGTFEIRVGEQTHVAAAGTVVFGPRNVLHAFRNTGPTAGTLQCVTTPGGIERFFEQLSDLLHADPPPAWQQLSQLAAQHRIVAYQP